VLLTVLLRCVSENQTGLLEKSQARKMFSALFRRRHGIIPGGSLALSGVCFSGLKKGKFESARGFRLRFMSLKRKVSTGIKWASLSLVLIRLTRFATGVVLARLLAPRYFGIVAMATVAVETLGVLRHVGIGSAYIYREFKNPEEKRRAENTVFFVVSAIAVVLFLTAVVLSPLLASFFRHKEVASVLTVMAVSFLFEPFATVPNLILLKSLRFDRQARCEIAQALAYAAAGIPLAVLGAGVWSLVGALLASRAAFAIAALLQARWRPRWEYSPALAREFFGYGKFLWITAILTAAGEAFDKAVVGRLWGAVTLGFYQISFSVARLPAGILVNMFEKISFPAFSVLRDDGVKLPRAFLQTTAQLAALTAPVAFGLFALGEDFVSAVYGDAWRPAVPFIRVLAFFGLLQCLAPVPFTALKAIGAPGSLMKLSLWYHGLLVGLVALLYPFGAVGVCWALAGASGVSTAAAFLIVRRKLDLELSELVSPLSRSFICAGIMAAGIGVFRTAVIVRFEVPSGLALVSGTVVGVVLYFASTWLLNRRVLLQLLRSAGEVIRSSGGRGKSEEEEPVGVGAGTGSGSGEER